MTKITCGHKDRKHKAFGLCQPCYQKARAADPVLGGEKRAYHRAYMKEVRRLQRDLKELSV